MRLGCSLLSGKYMPMPLRRILECPPSRELEAAVFLLAYYSTLFLEFLDRRDCFRVSWTLDTVFLSIDLCIFI